MQDNTKITITAKMRIRKYEGDPVGEPFDVVERELVLTGQEAEDVLKQIKESGNNGSN